jgi:cytochrome c5
MTAAIAAAAAAQPSSAQQAPSRPEPQATAEQASTSPAEAATATPATTGNDIFDVLRELLHKSPPSLQYDYRRLMFAVALVIS